MTRPLEDEDEMLAQLWASRVTEGSETKPGEVPVPDPPVSATRDHRRSRRHHGERAKSASMKRAGKMQLRVVAETYPEQPGVDYRRPEKRAECVGGERPCPFVSCAHNLYLDVAPRTGAIKINFPDLEPWEIRASCVLDVADAGEATLEEVGGMMNLTRERIRQIEVRALGKVERAARVPGHPMAALADNEGFERRRPDLGPEEDDEELEDAEDEDGDAENG